MIRRCSPQSGKAERDKRLQPWQAPVGELRKARDWPSQRVAAMNQPDDGSARHGRGVSSVSLVLERHQDVLSTEIPSVARPLSEETPFVGLTSSSLFSLRQTSSIELSDSTAGPLSEYGSCPRSAGREHGPSAASSCCSSLFLERRDRHPPHPSPSLAAHLCTRDVQTSHISRSVLPDGVSLRAGAMPQLSHLPLRRDVPQL